MSKIGFKKIFDRRNRGILLDIVVFLFNLTLLRILIRLSRSLVVEAQTDVSAKIVVSLFLVGLFFLQPLGPMLKRWSFHRRHKSFGTDQPASTTGCLLSLYKFFYIAIMAIIFCLAYAYFKEAFTDFASDRNEKLVLVGAITMSLVNAKIIFSYFRPPQKEPRWKFLKTPQSESLGDICLFLNVICFQIVWGIYISSPQFWNLLHKITDAGSNDFFDGLLGRLYVAGIVALLVYFPPRIFYLVVDQHRKITWLTMLAANLPLILGIVFYAPVAAPARALVEPSFTVAAQDLYREYRSDHEAGMRKYLGKRVNVTGTVRVVYVPQSIELDAEVGLDGRDGYPLAHCYFDADQTATIKTLQKNQIVTLQCVGSDFWGNGPSLKHCVLADGQGGNITP